MLFRRVYAWERQWHRSGRFMRGHDAEDAPTAAVVLRNVRRDNMAVSSLRAGDTTFPPGGGTGRPPHDRRCANPSVEGGVGRQEMGSRGAAATASPIHDRARDLHDGR